MTIFIVVSSWPQVIARVHSVQLMNVEQCQVAADPQTEPRDLGCEFACRLLSSTTAIATYYYYYSARKLILIYRPTEGRRLSCHYNVYMLAADAAVGLCRLAFGNEYGIAVVDIVQRVCILNIGTPDLYGTPSRLCVNQTFCSVDSATFWWLLLCSYCPPQRFSHARAFLFSILFELSFR